jgi:hypothetical protein
VTDGPPLAPLAPHQPRPARDAAHALEREDICFQLCATRSLAGSCRTASAYRRSSGYSGHRSLAMTLRYGHLAPESQRHAGAKLNGMLGRRTTAAPGHKQSTRESAPQNREPAADRPHVRRPRGAGDTHSMRRAATPCSANQRNVGIRARGSVQ